MNSIDSILKACTIRQIYQADANKTKYQIPPYQRNYAWERDEVQQLISDICSSMEKDKQKPYYIGTLVTFKRDEGVFEVIDGQQRLTTLYIILKALRTGIALNKLTYTARQTSATTIERMPDFGEEGDRDQGICNGYKYASEKLDELFNSESATREDFTDYLLDRVTIIHYQVPKDIDLNHYFEVMNSRGEQLEKHEIVKAKLSNQFVGDNQSMEAFGKIWEACSEMSFYVQQKLQKRKGVFTDDLEGFRLKSFEAFKDGADKGTERRTIAELIDGAAETTATTDDYDRSDRFQPIIDFPNFLLIVLKITLWENSYEKALDCTLDDKELIDEFDKVELTAPWVQRLAYNLLRARYNLDNYVVHHANDKDRASYNPWELQRYHKEGYKTYTKDLAERTENSSLQEELVHLLSMFEVAFTPKQRKNYLFYVLLYLLQKDEEKGDGEINLEEYRDFLRALADKYFYDVYLNPKKLNNANHQPHAGSFDDTILVQGELCVQLDNVWRDFNSIYPQGSADIPLFVFCYTDYRLWRKYASELRSKETKAGSPERKRFFDELGCSDFGLDVLRNFYFSRTRKSLEHYYPQAKAGDGKPLTAEQINCFGNFAMIGSDANSSGSDWNPFDKQNRYLDSKTNAVSVASLKFRIMLQMCKDNHEKGIRDSQDLRSSGLEWNAADMQRHQQRMLSIIGGC